MKRYSDVTRSSHSRIAMVTRFPVAGEVKTRLIPALGSSGAARLHHTLTAHVATELCAMAAAGEAAIDVWHAGGTKWQMHQWLGKLPRYQPQPEGDFGFRLQTIFSTIFREGSTRCLVVGSDCPAMTARHLRQALHALSTCDVVFGPAADGGYWLIGINATAADRSLPTLFERIRWGSADVLQQSLERAVEKRLDVTLLEELWDVDRPEDLSRWRPQGVAKSITAVIPTLNEEASIGSVLSHVRRAGIDRIIVADGGSNDETCRCAADADAQVIVTPRGRARQMNAGAAHATGEILFFLHADTIPPPHAAARIREALALPGVVGGAFSYTASGAGVWDPILTAGGRLRCRLSGHPYGDQGLFLCKRTFESLGGFPDLPVMEDWELVHRLRKLGRVVVLPDPIVTSAASFAHHGMFRASLLNFLAIIGYQLGVDPHRLARARDRIARRGGGMDMRP